MIKAEILHHGLYTIKQPLGNHFNFKLEKGEALRLESLFNKKSTEHVANEMPSKLV